MPVLATTDEHIVPRSVLLRRPFSKKAPSRSNGKQKTRTTSVPSPITQRASRPPTRDTGSSVSRVGGRSTDTEPVPGRQGKVHPLFYLGLGMLVMLGCWLLITSAISWVTTTLDDVHYGRPRTFQTDAWVDHNEHSGHPSHFMVINFHRHIQVIEFPGGDATHSRVYSGPQLYGANDELTVVTLTFADVNEDRQRDMIINFQNSRVVLINEKGSFRALLPAERSQVEQFLQHIRP